MIEQLAEVLGLSPQQLFLGSVGLTAAGYAIYRCILLKQEANALRVACGAVAEALKEHTEDCKEKNAKAERGRVRMYDRIDALGKNMDEKFIALTKEVGVISGKLEKN